MSIDADVLRDWVRAEIESAIAYNEVDPDGYRGNNYRESTEADRIFLQVIEMFETTN